MTSISISYPVTNLIRIRNKTISTIKPTVTNPGTGPLTYSISPLIPPGLALNPTTGFITGKPTTNQGSISYTVTLTNTAGGNTTTTINIKIIEPTHPNGLSYPVIPTFTVNTSNGTFTPTLASTGSGTSTYSINPALPAGLALNSSTGVISGTPTVSQLIKTYKVTLTVTNSSIVKNTSDSFSIKINDVSPIGLSYPAISTFTVNTSIGTISRTLSSPGTGTLTYSINPALPGGFALNSTTGVITGTPTTSQSSKSYTVKVTNPTGGNTSSNTFIIIINDVPPTGLSYTIPPFTLNANIGIFNPTFTNKGTGKLTYSISPSIPAGLNFSTSTGVITGIPTTTQGSISYTVTVTNPTGGNTSSNAFGIQINDVAPSGLSYTIPPFIVSTSIGTINPTLTNPGTGTLNYSINTPLPAGLALNSTTGVITGTPTIFNPISSQYKITASNTGGNTTARINIKINDIVPSGLSYPAISTFTINNPIPSIAPTLTTYGLGTLTYRINQPVPTGLTFSTSTGNISGTPTKFQSSKSYTVTVTNPSGGNTSNTFSIQINDIAPSGLSYPTIPQFTINTQINTINPTLTNPGTGILNYSITPAIPAGLTLNKNTGIISGTPSNSQPNTPYTVTVTNTGGSTTATINILIKDIAPSDLIYEHAERVFLTNDLIEPYNPILKKGTGILTYSITPSIPSGLSINSTTGIITGTPSTAQDKTTYTVSVTNSTQLSTTTIFTIQILNKPPTGLSYFPRGFTFTLNSLIDTIIPTLDYGTAPLTYSISPSLPPGLIFDSNTGIIRGTPTNEQSFITYKISVSNTIGETMALISIQINKFIPSIVNICECPTPAIPKLGISFGGNLNIPGHEETQAFKTSIQVNTSSTSRNAGRTEFYDAQQIRTSNPPPRNSFG